MNRDRFCQKRTADRVPRKKRPTRNDAPAYTGELLVDFTNTDLYDLFVADTVVPINASWHQENDSIESGYGFEFELDIPAAVITGDATPKARGGEHPRQTIPFEVLYDETNPMITARYRSTDTAL